MRSLKNLLKSLFERLPNDMHFDVSKLDDFIRVKNQRTSSVELIDITSVLIIDYRNDYSLFRTRENDYLCAITEDGVLEIANRYNFCESSRDLYVNLNEAKKIHSELNAVLFDDIDSFKESKEKRLPTAFLHTRYIPKFKKFFGKENDLAYKLEVNGRNSKYPFSFKKNISDQVF